jgi:single-strand DNA-binding protein
MSGISEGDPVMAPAHTAPTTLDASNVALLAGELSGEPRHRELPSGSVLVEFDVTTRGDSGTGSVPVAWFDPGTAADGLAAGSDVVVAGHVRRRFFRAGGVTQSRTEVVATRVIVNGRPAAVAKLRRSAARVVSPHAD